MSMWQETAKLKEYMNLCRYPINGNKLENTINGNVKSDDCVFEIKHWWENSEIHSCTLLCKKSKTY